ncbi:hypothetical protein SDC9_202876 [bioreactor metagenome]|uniref:Uncharacterized protein n=1 Tax=bioreactor metagenome TaxID=1076179 RepID=A0A645IVN1_9ZZZZ
MDGRPDTDPKEHVKPYFLDDFLHLIKGIIHPVLPGQLGFLQFNGRAAEHKRLDLVFQMRFPDEGSADYRKDQTHKDIRDGDPPVEDAGQKDDGCQIDQRR